MTPFSNPFSSLSLLFSTASLYSASFPPPSSHSSTTTTYSPSLDNVILSPDWEEGVGGGDDDMGGIGWGVDICEALTNRTAAQRGVANETWGREGREGGGGGGGVGGGLGGGDVMVCNGPHSLDGQAHTVIVYAYITPVLVTFTLVTNLLVCIVLMRSTRSPTNTLLVAMAVSDTLTGVWPIPCFLYFYTAGRYTDWLPYSWCYIYFCLTDYLPTVFHTASIWLTVSLAVQRYVSVCHPLAGKRLCTNTNILKVIVGVYAASFASQISKFFELNFHPVRLPSRDNIHPSSPPPSPFFPSLSPSPSPYLSSSTTQPDGAVIVGCYETLAQFVRGHTSLYYNSYYWFRVIFIHLVPCTSLVLLNAALVQTLRAAQRRRQLLLRQNRCIESRRLEESNSTTMMLVAVVGLFLLVEVPLALFLIVFIWDNTFGDDTQPAMSAQTVLDVSLLINLVILLSYPLNFFIYCGMSRQFRDTFRRLFVRSAPAASAGGASTVVGGVTESCAIRKGSSAKRLGRGAKGEEGGGGAGYNYDVIGDVSASPYINLLSMSDEPAVTVEEIVLTNGKACDTTNLFDDTAL